MAARFFGVMAVSLLTAALAAIATGVVTRTVVLFFAGAIAFGVLVLAVESRAIRTRVPIGQPFPTVADRLRREADALRSDPTATAARAVDWDRRMWRAIEQEYHEKGAALRNRQGEITEDMTPPDVDRYLRQHCDLLDQLIIGTL